MTNHILNIAIALIEGRTSKAREILREPAFCLDHRGGDAVAKLQAALETREKRAVCTALHQILAESMTLDVLCSPEYRSAYLDGVKAVEDVIEKRILDAEPEPIETKDDGYRSGVAPGPDPDFTPCKRFEIGHSLEDIE